MRDSSGTNSQGGRCSFAFFIYALTSLSRLNAFNFLAFWLGLLGRELSGANETFWTHPQPGARIQSRLSRVVDFAGLQLFWYLHGRACLQTMTLWSSFEVITNCVNRIQLRKANHENWTDFQQPSTCRSVCSTSPLGFNVRYPFPFLHAKCFTQLAVVARAHPRW